MLTIKKFGGTSVGTVDRINKIADILEEEYLAKSQKIIVVLSAMAGMTNDLIEKSMSIYENYSIEHDLIISTGEQISVGLLSLALHKRNIAVQTYMAWQLPIIGTSEVGSSKIISINTDNILNTLAHKKIVIIPGFQAIDQNNNITTLGRGGSDTTAIAVAAACKESGIALNAVSCVQIYTDVAGVFTADPRIVQNVKQLPYLHYDEMLELANLGAKIMHDRSIMIAMKYNIMVQIMSSFGEEKITVISDNLDNLGGVEHFPIKSITHKNNISIITVYNVSVMSEVCALSKQLDTLSVFNNTDGTYNIHFAIDTQNAEVIYKNIEIAKYKINYSNIEIKNNLSKISIVGIGIASNQNAICKILDIFKDEGIVIFATSIAQIKISLVIEAKYAELVVRLLHDDIFHM